MFLTNSDMNNLDLNNYLEMEMEDDIHSNDKYDSNMIESEIHYTSWSPIPLGYKFVEDIEYDEVSIVIILLLW